MVILEGPDGSGKSTLAEKLKEQIGGEIIHSGGPILSPSDLKLRIDSLTYKAHDKAIIDRFPYLSEAVYGKGRVLYSDQLIDLFKRYRKEHDLTLIYCRTDPETMLNNISKEKKSHKSRDLLEVVMSEHEDIRSRYDELMSKVKPDIIYDWQKDTVENVRSNLKL